MRDLHAALPGDAPSLSVLHRYIKGRRARTPSKTKRVSDKEIFEAYEQQRELNARCGDHFKVTSIEVTEKIQDDHDGETRFKTRSRILKATQNRPELRDPTKDPQYGDRALASQAHADLKHHCR